VANVYWIQRNKKGKMNKRKKKKKEEERKKMNEVKLSFNLR
jgi:hypothetical protein